MALFGGQRNARPDWGRALTFAVQGTRGLDRQDAIALAQQQRMQEQQALQHRTMQEDRLRAALSPADSEAGSGMGAAPSIQQQMAALDEARLLNPEVADKFAPLVQGRRMAELTQSLPIEQRLAIELNPERAGQSFATQFEDMPLAAGTIRSRGNQAVIGAPRVERFDDRFGSFDPVTGNTSFSEPRSPTFAEQTQRLGAGQSTVGRFRLGPDGQPIFEAPSEFTLGADQRRFENGEQVAGPAADPNAGLRSEQSLAAISNTRRAVTDAKKQVGVLSTGVVAGLIPFNQWKSNLEATADTIEANLSFNALQQMRDASKTGGALGGIAIRELELLGSTIASLKTSQSPEQFERSLNTIDASLDRWEKALSQPQPGQPQQSGASSARPIAVNPQTGQRVQWNGSEWVPI